MNNILLYYYDLNQLELVFRDERYYFEYLDRKYIFEAYNRPLIELETIYEVNKKMIENNILVHEIVKNKENNILTFINGINYCLMEVFVNEKTNINLPDICYVNNNSVYINNVDILNRADWINLWGMKNDYFEEQINEIGKRYNWLSKYINYYIGMAENAISYMHNISNINEEVLYSICSKRINYKSSLIELYNPLNYIYDYRVRDASEYIKSSFFYGVDAMKLVEEYFENNYLNYKEALIFYARLLYPSYFFDLYDDILNKKMPESNINDIVQKSCEYEEFLRKVYYYLTNLYKRYIPYVDWIIKRSF